MAHTWYALEFQGRVWRMPAAQREARIQEMLTDIGLWERRFDLIGQWSRGMKQKLAVARAMFHRPELIFLDERPPGWIRWRRQRCARTW